MSIKRIETMTGAGIKKVIDVSHRSDCCDNCPLFNDNVHCAFGTGTCLENIINWLYQDADGNDDMDEIVTIMSTVAASIHDLIASTVEMSGLKISASDFAQMIANRIREEENDG